MPKTAAILILLVGSCWSAPADEPIRIDLPVFDQPRAASDTAVASDTAASSDTAIASALQPENYPGGDPVHDIPKGFISYKAQTASNAIGDTLSAKASFGGPFSDPATTLEAAVPEHEGYGSKILSFKENLQHGAAGIFQPKPIVDTIAEEEKYGNNGDKFFSAGRAIVGGAENLSNFVNSILQVPGMIFGKVSRIATEKLNNLGGKLIGLAK